ncbi:MAG: N-acetylmuramoyl-L-alanine amidase [Mycobacterium leprae]
MSRPACRLIPRHASLTPTLIRAVVVPATVVASVVGLPVVTAPVARPHPVPPTVHTLPLAPLASASVAASGPGGGARAAAASGRPLVLTPPRATARYDLVGVTWAYDAHVGDLRVAVRTRTAGRWSGWRPLDADRDEAPDEGVRDMHRRATRAGTSPFFVGDSDGVQVRVDLLRGRVPRDLRIDLVDPGRSAADEGVDRSAPPAAASAGTDTPPVVSRRQWGADERLRSGPPTYAPAVKVAFVHHTVTGNGYTRAQAAALVRSIYAYHTRSLGWWDIGYNFLVDAYGRVFEGRYGGIARPVIGAHTGGFNVDSVGVALLGTYTTGAPSSPQLRALERLLAWKLGENYRDPTGTDTLVSAGGGTTRFPRGAAVRFPVISGHRDAGSTSCPGNAAYARLPAIRSATRSAIGAGLVAPSAIPVTDGRVRVTAGVLRPQRWVAQLLDVDESTVLAQTRGRSSGVIDTVLAPRRAHAADTYVVRLRSWAGGNAARPYTARVPLPGVDQVAAAAERGGEVLLASRADSAAASVRSWRPGGSLGGADRLGGVLVGAPDVLVRGDGAQVHVRGADDAIYRAVRSGGGRWSGWQRLGGRILATPRAVELPSGEVALAAVGADRALWVRASERARWRRVGGVVLLGSAPGAAAVPDGRLAVAVVGTDRRAWVTTVFPDGRSTGWSSLGGVLTGNLTAAARAGGLLVAGGGANGGVYVTRISGGGAARWARVGRLSAVGSPALVVPARGAADEGARVVATAADERLYTADPLAGPRAGWAGVG